MTSDISSGRGAGGTPGVLTPAGADGQARKSRVVGRRPGMVVLLIGLGMLRSRRFHEQVITGAIRLAALTRIAHQNEARAWAGLVAWDKRQNLREQRSAKTGPA